MSDRAEPSRQGAGQAWVSLTEGWRELSARARGALGRVRQIAQPLQDDLGQPAWLPSVRWGLMAAGVQDDGDRLVVRVEAPGLRRDDFHVEVVDGVLTVWGEKSFDPGVDLDVDANTQCAYGRFRRDVALPAAVDADRVRTGYRDGVLCIEMSKIEAVPVRRGTVRDA